MLGEILLFFFILIGVLNVLHFGLFQIGANLYDAKDYKRRSKLPKRRRINPLVSVVVPAHNESVSIGRTIRTVLKSSYRNIEIIVVDDGSNDDTAMIVRKFIADLPERRRYYLRRDSGSNKLRRVSRGISYSGPVVRLVKQSNGGKASAMNNGIKNYARGELVMCLDADSQLSRHAIRNAVNHFNDPSVVGIAANVRISNGRSVLGVLQKFEHMIGYRSKKFFTMTNSEFLVGGVASTYRMDVLRQVEFYDTDTITEDIGLSMKIISKIGNRHQKIVYASDVVAMTEGVNTFKELLRQRYRWKMGNLQNLLKYRHMIANRKGEYSRALTHYRLPMAIFGEILLLLQPLMLTYIFYLAISYRSFGVFIGAYIVMTLVVIMALWPDENTNRWEKVKWSPIIPLMYFIFYIMDTVQIISVFKCLINHRQMRRIDIQTTWISPKRSEL